MSPRPFLLAFLLLSSILTLAACGNLPQPFYGNPGATGALLAQPPPSRLTIPPPTESLLPDAAGTTWAAAVAEALVAQEIPAAAGRSPARTDWTLTLAAETQNGQVVPSYTVRNPAGQAEGVSQGAPIQAAAWAAATPATLKAAATQAAPGIVALLGRIDASRKQSDPASLLNRPARVYLAGTTGAPGDGNQSLPAQMRIKLQNNGIVVQDTPKNADFELKGDVASAPGLNGTVRIEIQWTIRNAAGEVGRILQINEVPPRTIVPYWGDVAVAAATEAAGGVHDVIVNAGGRK